jgi:hypothetical protein
MEIVFLDLPFPGPVETAAFRTSDSKTRTNPKNK